MQRAGLALYALTPEQRDLEAVFAEVNRVAVTGTARPAAEVAHA